MLIKDTKYRQHRSKRFRPTPQAALMKDESLFDPLKLAKELFELERFDDSHDRKLARQSIIYDDHLQTKPGFVAICEEYERDLADASNDSEDEEASKNNGSESVDI